MRILFANHTSAWSGAEVSLMRLAEELRGRHEIAVACPGDGPLAEAVDRAGIERLPVPPVAVSMRIHAVQTPVGVGQLAAAGVALARAARRFRPDILHANSLRSGIMATAVGSGVPVVVRTHDRLPLTPLGRAVRLVVMRRAAAIVAVSDYTARMFNSGLSSPVATRVYNSIDHDRFDPERVEPAELRKELGLGRDAFLLGQVAQITPWKGQDTAIRALACARREGLDAHLLLVGGIAFTGTGVRYDNRSYLRTLGQLVDALDVRPAVHFLGQRADVPAVLHGLDLSLLPSWDEPFGLVTVESMALGTPPLVSSTGAGPELVHDRISGRLIAPQRPEAWAEAARKLAADGTARKLMGERARAGAARFRDDVQAREMLEVYAGVLEAAGNARHVSRSQEATPWPG